MREKPSLLLPALYGGLLIGVIAVVPGLRYINACCCAGVLIGGILAVFLYKKDFLPDMPPLENGDALKVGALAGAIGGVVATILQQVMALAFNMDPKIELQEQIDAMSGQPGTEGAIGMMEWFMSMMDSPFFIIGSLIFSVVLYGLFGLLGGLIGFQIFKPKQQMMNVPPPQQPR